jgi:hypothetical protein
LTSEAFALNDKKQVLRYAGTKVSYLVRLNESDIMDNEKFLKEKVEIEKRGYDENKFRYVNAFIASLKRNVKIEPNQNLLNAYVFNTP